MQEPDRPHILVLPPILVGGLLLVGVSVHYWLWTVTPFPIVPARILGVVLFVSAGVLAHAAHNAMKRAGTNIFPTQPALALVSDGPVTFLLLPIVVAGLHWAVVMPEERYLEGKFGDAYRAYQSQVPRWL